MPSLRYSVQFIVLLTLLLVANGASAQVGTAVPDTLNKLDEAGRKQGWWKVVGPVKDKPDYTAGKLYEEGRYADNRRVGVWKRYWPNGKVMSQINYVMGLPKGPYTTYYPDGTTEEQGTWDLDRNTGGFKRWHANGKLSQEFLFDNYGTRDGEQKYYHENGQLEVDVHIKQGREEGTLKRYFPNGELAEVAEFHDGVASSSKSFQPKSKMPVILAADAKPAPDKTPDETPNATAFQVNGMNTLYDMQHRLAQQGEYRNGRLWNGKVYKYDRNGILFRVEAYVDGRYAGNAVLTEDDKH